jgi:PAS domain S-box-containing protein
VHEHTSSSSQSNPPTHPVAPFEAPGNTVFERLQHLPPDQFRREAVLVLDHRGRVVEWNRAAELIFGFEREEVLDRRVRDLIVPPDQADAQTRRFAALALPGAASPAHNYVTEGMRSDGQRIPLSVRVKPTDTEPVNYVISVEDLSGHEPTELAHRHLEAMIDSSEDAMALLGLDGRILTWNRGAESLYGFTPEEATGRLFASFLVPGERMNEPLEWLPLLQDGQTVERETERLHRTGEKIWVSLRMIPMRDEREQVVGIIWIGRDVSDRHRLEELDAVEAEAAELGRRTKRAISEGGLHFAAQPIVGISGEGVDHYELLLRMRTETGELMTPDRFLPYAERTGLITEIDLWVVEKGIEIAARHPVSINLSAAGVGREAVCERIESRLRETGVDPSRITFELTETAAAEDIDRASELVQRLAALGFGIALDDFGTGFGSFTYLKRLPVTHLKIDLEFVRDLVTNEANRRVVQAIVSLARAFGLRTVAEGVEDQPTLDLLRAEGVDYAQGFHIGRPQPSEQPDPRTLDRPGS